MTYIDGFVAAVPSANKQKYIDHAKWAATYFKKHGAMKLVECWGDDVPQGDVTSFPMAVKKEDDETVVFSWITWPDKKTRDAGMPKVFADMESADTEMSKMPFDGKRMIFGGFDMVFET